MVLNKLWTPFFLCFAAYEYFNGVSFCGTMSITGQMWFMWLMMAITASGNYFNEKS